MADLTVTKAQVSPVFPGLAEIYDYIAAVAITAGQAVYVNSSGKVDLVSGSAVGTAKIRGIALNDAGIGQAVSVLKKGAIYGFTISGLAYDATVYVSNTTGALADAAGTNSCVAGKVMPLTDKDITKVLYITDWAN